MKKYILSPNIELQPLEDSLVVLALEKNTYYSLNGSGRWFFEHILKSPLDDVVRDAQQHFSGVSEDALRRDCIELIELLESAGIIRGE